MKSETGCNPALLCDAGKHEREVCEMLKMNNVGLERLKNFYKLQINPAALFMKRLIKSEIIFSDPPVRHTVIAALLNFFWALVIGNGKKQTDIMKFEEFF